MFGFPAMMKGAIPPPLVTYATWNSLDKGGNIVLSEGNLRASNSYGSNQFVRANMYKSSGVWYWEYTIHMDTSGQSLGLRDTNGDPYIGYVGNVSNSIGYVTTGAVYLNGVGTLSQPAFTVGDVMGVVLNINGGQVHFLKSGVIISTWSIVPNIPYSPAVGLSPGNIKANFGATPFIYPVPTGANPGFYT